MTLVARLNETNDGFLDFHLMSRIERRSRFWLKLNDPWLKGGKRLDELASPHLAIRGMLKST
jgi:hypothetical protein